MAKINLFEMGEMLRAGKITREIAEHFRCTERAVQKRAKKFGLQITKQAMFHQVKDKVRQDLDVREQLLKINDSATRLLNMLEAQLEQDRRGVVDGLKAKLVQFRQVAQEGDVAVWGPVLEGVIEEIDQLSITRVSTVEQLLKVQAEIRQQMALVVKVMAELLEAQRVNEVHRIMLEEIGVESAECQGRIVRRLQGSNLLLTAVGGA